MTAPFLTIAQDTTNEIIIKKSRFICSLFRVESEEKAQAAIAKINKLHRKATHNCFAYLIGEKVIMASQAELPACQCWRRSRPISCITS